jgi:hypothetical protein
VVAHTVVERSVKNISAVELEDIRLGEHESGVRNT